MTLKSKIKIRSISMFLIISLILNILLPLQTLAAQETQIPTPGIYNTSALEKPQISEGKIVQELTDKRELNIKHFLKDDNTYEAAVYPLPVHYLDNGAWQDIDNTLVEAKDEEKNSVLENTKNDFKIKFANSTQNKNLVSIQKGDYKLSWNLVGAQASVSEKSEPDLKAFAALSENDKKKSVPKNASGVNFTNALPDTDLNYSVKGNAVKEDIVLNKVPENPVYTFNLSTTKLIPILQKDKSIIFYDEKDKTNGIFEIPTPYMYDAKHEENGDIKVTLTETQAGYSLSLEPSKDWLNSPDRQYPVVIDPIVNTSLDKSSIHDTWVMSGLPTENRDNSVLLGVGCGTISKVTRTYAKFDLPALSSGDMVTSAQFSSCLYTTQPDVRQINVHKVNSDWTSTTLIWNNKPAYNPKIEDYAMVSGAAGTFINWDVTGIVKDWYTSGNNNGLMLKQQDETVGYEEFFSSDTSATYTIAHPQVSIRYVNNTGLESYWTYHSQDVGRAGTGYINDYNGNLIYKHDDLSMSGSKLPVNIQHIFNSNDKTNLAIGYGNGWRLNLSQRITHGPINGTDTYCYTDDDGTKHYFYYDIPTSTYKDEDGLNITLTMNGDGTYNVKDKTTNKLIFNTSGYLTTIKDQNGNTLTLSYTGGVLRQITDGSGRVTTLNCNSEGTLTEITNPSGTTSFGYTGGTLTSITYPDGKQTTYTYDANGNLTSTKNYDGYKISYTYSSGTVQRVLTALESHTDGTLGQQTTLAYGNNLTTFADVNGKKDTFQFNNWGNTISTRDSEGTATYVQYNEATGDANKNRALLESKRQKTTVNYLKNHNAEFDTDWSFINDAPSTGTGNYTTVEKYQGSRSLQVTKTNSSSKSYYQQVVTLEKGKTYTYSGYIKTQGVTNASGQGAHLLVHYQNSAGIWQQISSPFLSGVNDWGRQQVTFTVPADAASTDVLLRTAIEGESGNAYFDCLQLEDGSAANRYNLIENPDFRNGSFTSWNKSADTDSSDDLVYIDPSTDPNYVSADIDRNAFKINGIPNKNKMLYQTVNVSGNAGDNLVLSGWAKGSSVPLIPGREFALCVGVQGLDNTYQWISVPFNQDSSDWQYASSLIKTDRAYKSINVYGLYYNNANTAYFDGFRLYKEDFGTSYSYDSKGNLASSTDLSKANSSFAYNTTNDLITSTDPKGSNFNYTYDPNHNITTATSAQNVKYSFTYDSSGNPLTSKVGDSTLFTQSSATYTTPSGNYLSTLTDASGNTVSNQWDETKGLLSSTTDAKNKTTNYTYELNTNRLSSVSKTVSGQPVTNSYTYQNDRIQSITQNGFNYNFGYDSLGNNTKVSVGTQNLITNSFESRTGKLLQSTYGNGQVVSQDYDSSNRVTASKYNGTIRNTYAYDNNGNLGAKQDLVNGNNYQYLYDFANRLTNVTNSNGNSQSYSYDTNSNLNNLTEQVGGRTYTSSYAYDKDNRPTTTSYNNEEVLYPDGGFELGTNTVSSTSGNLYSAGILPPTFVNSRTGNKCFWMESASSDGYAYLSSTTPVVPGRTYTISLYHTEATSGQFTKDSSYMRLSDGSHVPLGIVQNPDQTWRNTVKTWTCPAGITSIQLRFGFGANSYSWMAVDDVVISAVNPPVANTPTTITQSYDALGRVSGKSVTTDSATYNTTYGYLAGVNGSGSTTTKVQSITNNGVGTSYTYDTNGNIETITQNGQVTKYYYDELNEVIREDNQELNKTNTYAYDLGGNITEKVAYAYTTGALGTPTQTINYGYADSNWKDKLNSYDGKAITSDAIGNPLTYDGWTYTWEEGRQLATMVKGATNLSFKYNDSGIRTQKTVNGVTTKYTLNGDKVTLEDNGTDKIYYTYGAAGNLVSMNLNGTEYYYIQNAQSDITGLFDKTGTQVVGYSYDTWGKLFSTTGTLASTIGAKNPYLYRGYRSDSETGLYYLQSRYYNADWGRFVNADGNLGAQGELLFANVFAYCVNNTINLADHDGNRPDVSGGPEGLDAYNSVSPVPYKPAKVVYHNATTTSARTPQSSNASSNVIAAKKKDIKDIKDVARELGLDHRGFGDYVEERKPLEGINSGTHMPYRELRKWGQDYAEGQNDSRSTRIVSGVGIVLYWTVSIGSRLVPARWLVPIP